MSDHGIMRRVTELSPQSAPQNTIAIHADLERGLSLVSNNEALWGGLPRVGGDRPRANERRLPRRAISFYIG